MLLMRSRLRRRDWAKLGRGLHHGQDCSATAQEIKFPWHGSRLIVSIFGKIPGDHWGRDPRNFVPKLFHNSSRLHWLDTLDVNKDKSNCVKGDSIQPRVNFVGGWTWRELLNPGEGWDGNEQNRCFTGVYFCNFGSQVSQRATSTLDYSRHQDNVQRLHQVPTQEVVCLIYKMRSPSVTDLQRTLYSP